MNKIYTVKRNTDTLYNGADLTHAKWRFQLSAQLKHSRQGLVLDKLNLLS